VIPRRYGESGIVYEIRPYHKFALFVRQNRAMILLGFPDLPLPAGRPCKLAYINFGWIFLLLRAFALPGPPRSSPGQ